MNSSEHRVVLRENTQHEVTARCEMCGQEHVLNLRLLYSDEDKIMIEVHTREPTVQFYGGRTDSIIE